MMRLDPFSFLTMLQPRLQNRSKGEGRRENSVRPSSYAQAGSVSSPVSSAFTIVELLIVIVVIGILATITIVAFNGITRDAAAAALKSDLKQASTTLELHKIDNSTYPTTEQAALALLTPSPTHTFEYTFTPPNSYCLSITNPTTTNLPGFHITNTTPEPSEGVCEGHTPPPSGGGDEGDPITDGDFMQDVTTANCPTERTMAVDARDNHTYWVQKLADGKCWMLTNLGYTGDTSNGGSDSYGDTRTIVHETTSTNSYTQARYQTPVYSGTLVTIYPTEPSTDTTGGTAAGRQRGYFYNWCAAMGVQTGTSACLQSVTQPYDANVSICPSGWRLPTGGPAPSELATLNGSVNGGLTNTDAGLRTTWLAQRAGFWNSMHFSSGTRGDYWSSTQYDASSAYTLHVSSSTVGESAPTKQLGFSVRCLAV